MFLLKPALQRPELNVLRKNELYLVGSLGRVMCSFRNCRDQAPHQCCGLQWDNKAQQTVGPHREHVVLGLVTGSRTPCPFPLLTFRPTQRFLLEIIIRGPNRVIEIRIYKAENSKCTHYFF